MDIKKVILLLICTIIVDFNLFSQQHKLESGQFYDYNTIIKDLNINGTKSKYYSGLDFQSMLYLDKTSLKTLKKINRNFLVERGIDTSNVFFKVPERYVNEFSANFNTIKELFSPKSNLFNVFGKIRGMDLDDIIYIKDDSKAIFTVYHFTWSYTYRVTLISGKIRFELLYTIQFNPSLPPG